jgi:hypothetical protein
LFWAGIASLGIGAILALLMLAGAGFGFASYCSVTEADGILADVDPPDRARFSFLETEEGGKRTVPPGKECLLFGHTEPSAGDPGGYRLIASRYYPQQITYLWIPALVLLPFAVLAATRLTRRVARGTRRRQPKEIP